MVPHTLKITYFNILFSQEEEIDPVDGCTVRVFTYRILSADEMEELTKTVRQKIKFDCTQTMRSLKMIGSEANVS